MLLVSIQLGMFTGCFSDPMGKFLSKSRSKFENASDKKRKSGKKSSRYGARQKYAYEGYDEVGEIPDFRQFPPAHEDGVTCLAPVGPNLCLSGSKDQSVALFDFGSGLVLHKWSQHEKEVNKVAYGPHVQAYFSASRDKNICLWKDGRPSPALVYLGHDLVVTGLSLSQDNSQLVSGSRDNTVRLWDVHTGECVGNTSVSRNLVTHVKWGAGSDVIAQSGEDKEVKIWDARTLQIVGRFPRKQHIQTCCDLNADSTLCLTSSNGFGGNGCEATLWDVRTNKLVCEYKGHYETVGACMFVPSPISGGRKLLATCSNDCTVRLWDQESRECVACVSLPGSGPLTSIAAFEDGSICVGSLNLGIQVLQLAVSFNGVELTRKAQY